MILFVYNLLFAFYLFIHWLYIYYNMKISAFIIVKSWVLTDTYELQEELGKGN